MRKHISWFILFLEIGVSVFILLETGVAGVKKPLAFSVHPIPLEIQTEQRVVSYQVEIASSPTQSQAGLMYRTDFPRDRAMLFMNLLSDAAKDKQEILMWMANTPLPLDMIFLNAEGIIVSIFENTIPFSRNVISSKVPATFVIEVNAGEVVDKQIQRGQRVIHPAICGKCESDKK
ncbi:DUF192 domain-containing protein [Bartonella sp. A05]|uniref:DUF192 domain-containing protein n=1 Tax=Bartonella sp. A05 TaxID=2967261 RepID=UPI0022A8F95F|nr:DUF192 domain-containing protein [Bartonella sp. A05]MCZ2204250.1 DUF192 domain-containing protein [Bartonella sp. A05]